MVGTDTNRHGAVPTRTLVLSAIDADGTLDAEPLFVMATASGHSDKAVRDCLTRVVREELLTHVGGRGRSARYRVTGAGRAALDADLGWTAFAHRVDAGLEPWDRHWRIVGFEVPEKRRGARDALRSLLVEMGAAPIQPGLYVHAYELSAFVRQLADHLRVSDTVTYFATRAIRTGADGGDQDVVDRLWPLVSLADRYESVERQLASIVERAPFADGDSLAASMFAAIVHMETVMRDDPLLPLELLPDDWAGIRARRAFRLAHSAVGKHSELFNSSRLMQTFAAEINRALEETAASFWHRWFPRLVQVYQARLPPAATG